MHRYGTVLAFAFCVMHETAPAECFFTAIVRGRWNARTGPIRSLRTRATVAALLFSIPIAGCGFNGRGSSQASQPPPPAITVSISPASATLSLGQTQQFTAVVQGASSQAVAWSVNGIAGGDSADGTVSDDGLYTAPAVMPPNSTVTISATSRADLNANASANVQLRSNPVVNITISPASATVSPGSSLALSAAVSGASNSAVIWMVNSVPNGNATFGTISSESNNASPNSAIYTAPEFPPSPATLTIAAVSVQDSTKSAAASVTISCAAANSLSPASISLQAGSTQTFAASLCVSAAAQIAWDVNGIVGGNSTLGSIASSGQNAAIYTAPPTAPPSAIAIHATAGTQSAAASISISSPTPISIVISPASASLETGQRATFTASVSGSSSPALIWSANGIANGNLFLGQICAPQSNPCAPPAGNETSVDYIAPAAVPPGGIVSLTAASAENPLSSATAQIAISAPAAPSITISPFYAFLAPSQQFHFFTKLTGNIDPSTLLWSVASAVPGQGCSGNSCGTIDTAGNYTSPAVAPSPNAISITLSSTADPSLSSTATVALTSAPTIEQVSPSSVVAGAQSSFTLAVQGLNFTPTTASGSSQILINGLARATNCPTANRCTITLQASDVAAPGTISVELQNPGAPPQISNPASVIILPAATPSTPIALTALSPLVSHADVTVPEESTAGATTSAIDVQFAGLATADGSSCTLGASPLIVTRPASGTSTASICVQGNFLDPTFTYSFSSPQTGGDIGVAASSLASLFPNLIELTLTISPQTSPGLRSLFITTPNGDVAVATGILEVK